MQDITHTAVFDNRKMKRRRKRTEFLKEKKVMSWKKV